jgi:hypothetical protein
MQVLGVPFMETDEETVSLQGRRYRVPNPLCSILVSLRRHAGTFFLDTLNMYDPGQLRRIRFYRPTESLDWENREIAAHPYISLAGDPRYLEDFLVRLDDPHPENPTVYEYQWETVPYPGKTGDLSEFLSRLFTEQNVAGMV